MKNRDKDNHMPAVANTLLVVFLRYFRKYHYPEAVRPCRLSPVDDLRLVRKAGRPTYGKPVGYFGIPLGGWYIFPVSFRSGNKNGAGNYFDGMTPDAIRNDGLEKQWGGREEACLASVLDCITNGSFSHIACRKTEDIFLDNNNRQLNNRFNGALEQRSFRQE